MTIAMDKQALRRAMKDRLGALSPESWALSSFEVCRRLTASELWGTGGVLGYWAMPNEVDLSEAMREAMRSGRPVYCPRVDWASGVMEAARVTHWGVGEGGIRIGRFGVGEPRPEAEGALAGQVALVLVPGLAFDTAGMRLGRGAGFYDRYLSQIRRETRVVGVAIEEQLIEHVPHEAWDVAVDAIVTPTRIIEVRKK